MMTMDGANVLIGIANNTEHTNWGGIARRGDNNAFLAVQERRLSNATGVPSPRSSCVMALWLLLLTQARCASQAASRPQG